jgi:hypothetical protein
MRRFIILSVLSLAACLGSSASTQAAVVKRITTTKVTVQKQVVIERNGPRIAPRVGAVHFRPIHEGRYVDARWDFHRFHG